MPYAPVTAPRDAKRAVGNLVLLKVRQNVKIAKGTLVCADSAGFATHTVTAAAPFFGVAAESVDNTAGPAGAKSIRVYVSGVFSFRASDADQTWVGKEVFWDASTNGANDLVVITGGGVGPKVGRVTEVVSASEVRVRIDGYAFNVDARGS